MKINVYKAIDSVIQTTLLLAWVVWLVAGEGEMAILWYFIVGGYQLTSAILHKVFYKHPGWYRKLFNKIFFCIGIFWGLVLAGVFIGGQFELHWVFAGLAGIGVFLAVIQLFVAPCIAIVYTVQCWMESLPGYIRL